MSDSVYTIKIHQKGKDRVLGSFYTSCHSSVIEEGLSKFGIKIPDKKMRKDVDIETLDNWTKLLEELGIISYRDNDELMFDIDSSEKASGTVSLFFWQVIRFGLTRPAFCRKVLKLKVKFPSMNAWECIYLAWNIRPYKGISSYYTPFTPEQTFDYVEFSELIKIIKIKSSISHAIYSSLVNNSKIDVKKIKDAPLKDQLKSTEFFFLTAKKIGSDRYTGNLIRKNEANEYVIYKYNSSSWRTTRVKVTEDELKKIIDA